ncbi:MAG: hypothetical protein ACXVTC_20750 [Solirubrobacteraceae bacterium]
MAGAFGLETLALSAIAPASALAACDLGHGIQHVVILQFDNVHSERDNQGVASDLEQMPALRNFLTGNGTLLTNDHTILISHTAGGIVSTETGLYPDRNGLTVTNSYQVFDPNQVPNGNVGGSDFTSAFKYWTDPVGVGGDQTFNNDTGGGGNTNTPAPWVPFTRAGCDFAGLGAANMELENTTSDLTSVFGSGFDFGSLTKNATNLEGWAIHCSVADSQPGGVCGNGETDNLPSEPTGYATASRACSEHSRWIRCSRAEVTQAAQRRRRRSSTCLPQTRLTPPRRANGRRRRRPTTTPIRPRRPTASRRARRRPRRS